MASVQSELKYLKEIKAEVERFLSKVELLERELQNSASTYRYSSSKRSAVKRSSLDLSKELSNFRKNLTL